MAVRIRIEADSRSDCESVLAEMFNLYAKRVQLDTDPVSYLDPERGVCYVAHVELDAPILAVDEETVYGWTAV